MYNQPLDIFDAEAFSVDHISHCHCQPRHPECYCCLCQSEYCAECCLVHESTPCPATFCVPQTHPTWCRCCGSCHVQYTPSPCPPSAQAQSSISLRASRKKLDSGLNLRVSLEGECVDELGINDQQPCPTCNGCPACCICQEDAPTCLCGYEDEMMDNDRNEERERAMKKQSKRRVKMGEEGDMASTEGEVQVIMRSGGDRKVDKQQQTSKVRVPPAKRNKRCQCRIGVHVLKPCGPSICNTCKKIKRKATRTRKSSKEGRSLNCIRICKCKEETSGDDCQCLREIRSKASSVKNRCKERLKEAAKARKDAKSQPEDAQEARLTDSDSYLQCCYNYFSKLESKANPQRCARCAETVRRVWQSLKEHFTCETGARPPDGEGALPAKRCCSVSCCDKDTSPDYCHCFPPAELPQIQKSSQTALRARAGTSAFGCPCTPCVDLQKLCALLYANRFQPVEQEGKVVGVTQSALLLALGCRQPSKTQETLFQACQTNQTTQDVTVQKNSREQGVVTTQSIDEVLSESDDSTLDQVFKEKQERATFADTIASEESDRVANKSINSDYPGAKNSMYSNYTPTNSKYTNKSNSSDDGAGNSAKNESTGEKLLVTDQDGGRSYNETTKSQNDSESHPVKKSPEFSDLANIEEGVHVPELASASVNTDNWVPRQGIISRISEDSISPAVSKRSAGTMTDNLEVVPKRSVGSVVSRTTGASVVSKGTIASRNYISQGNHSSENSRQSFTTAEDTQAEWDNGSIPSANRRKVSMFNKDRASIPSKDGDSSKNERSAKIKLNLSYEDVSDRKDVGTSMSQDMSRDTDDSFVTISIENITGGAGEVAASGSVDDVSAIQDEDISTTESTENKHVLITKNVKALQGNPYIQDIHNSVAEDLDIPSPDEMDSSETQGLDVSEAQVSNLLINQDVGIQGVIPVDSAEDAVRSLESLGDVEISIEEDSSLDRKPNELPGKARRKKDSVTLQAVTYIPKFLDVEQPQTSKNFCIHHRVKHKHHHMVDEKRKVTFHEERCFYIHNEVLDRDTSELYFPKNANSVFSGSACSGSRRLRERGGGAKIQEPWENIFRSGVKGSKSEPHRMNQKLLLRCVKSSMSTVLLNYLENKKKRRK